MASANTETSTNPPLEIEERFLVFRADQSIYRAGEQREIEQGYFPETVANRSMRVRIICGANGGITAFLTVKTGSGRVRFEDERSIDLKTARLLLKQCPYIIRKTRYVTQDGWEVDELHDELEGIVLAEREVTREDEAVILPAWITDARNVTDSVTNLHLARLAYHLKRTNDPRPILDHLIPEVPLIVLTGGPASGKSTIMEECRTVFRNELHFVPEVASILISQVMVPPPTDPRSLDYMRFQKTLYRTQREFENLARMQARRDGKKAVLLDRGALDAIAYLPDNDRGCYEKWFGVQPCDDLKRYAKVIVLATPPKDVYERVRNNNPARTETFEEARRLFLRTFEAWSGTSDISMIWGADLIKDPLPYLAIAPASAPWDEKREHAISTIRSVLREIAI